MGCCQPSRLVESLEMLRTRLATELIAGDEIDLSDATASPAHDVNICAKHLGCRANGQRSGFAQGN